MRLDACPANVIVEIAASSYFERGKYISWDPWDWYILPIHEWWIFMGSM